MGDIQRIIRHFSHEHPLELTKLQQETPGSAVCAGCKFKASGVVYSCKTCNYVLHVTCSRGDPKIIHPFHPNHPLILFASPVYPEGVFACNACGREGSGFCYHCTKCEVDIDIICASMKLSVNHDAHLHPLILVFSPPYASKDFVCDICKKPGSDHWLYRCSGCQFDAHTTCGMSKRSASELARSASAGTGNGTGTGQAIHRTNSNTSVYLPRPPTQLNLQRLSSPRHTREISVVGTGFPVVQSRQVHHFSPAAPATLAVPYMVDSGRTDGANLGSHLVQGFVEGCGQQVGQSVVQGIMGGGGDLSSSLSSLGVDSSIVSSVVGGGSDPTSSLLGLAVSSVVSNLVGLN
ncbi:protein VACUOLELESS GAMETOPHYTES-like [Aristolochia californica]|uniref:protein VACUOLELESS GAMETOPHYTES-like n=1 Tax=Aristolochia californica TaxID=171875 RepID=UPI0035D66B0B